MIGDYIVDFVCFSKKMVIEVDGKFHGVLPYALNDQIRQTSIEQKGYRVLRFPAKEVLYNLQGVIQTIQTVLEYPPP